MSFSFVNSLTQKKLTICEILICLWRNLQVFSGSYWEVNNEHRLQTKFLAEKYLV